MSAAFADWRGGAGNGTLRDYRRFFHHAADPVVVTDREGRIVDANAAMARALGYRPDELLGKYVPALFATPDEGRRVREELKASDHVRDMPLRLLARDGATVELWLNATVRRDSRGRVVGYQAIARDVTEERRAVRRLRESERHFRDLIEHSSDLVSVIAPDGRVQYQGPTLQRILGYTAEELVGTNAFDRIHPEDVGRVGVAFQEVLKHPGRVLTEEFRHRHKDGDWRWIESTGRALIREQKLIGVVVNSRDITERRAAQHALRESEESFRNLFDSVSEMIAILGCDLRLINVNQATCHLLGYSREELVGMSPSELTDPEQEDVRQHFAAVLDGQSHHFEWCARSRDGRKLIAEVSLTPGRYFGRDVVIGVARDVTAQRSLEHRLLQAQKLEAVGRLAGGVAHDFNNVLTAILGNAQMLLEERKDDAALSEDLTVIVDAAQRASALTRQLMAFGRQQIIRPRVVDLNDVIRRAEKLVRPVMGEGRRLSIELSDELPLVEADPGQLEQVLLNLVMNAVDATPDDGTVRISTEVRAVEGGGQEQAPGGLYVVLRVADDGAGMSAAVRAQAFEPFFTTKPHGSGLGLSTVYGIVRQTGGYIALESRPGAGTKVDVLLPVSVRATRTSSSPHPEGGGGTVLVVEDEPAVRTLVRRALTRGGYRVIEAADGAEALAIVEREGILDSLDLMLSDVVMPNMLGPEMAERMRELRSDLPIVFMSGHSHRGRPELPRGPRPAFLPKPFTPDALVRTVRAMLESGTNPSAGGTNGD